MKTSKAVLNQLILALACVGLATPIFAHEQVKADELFGTVAVQEQVYGRGGASLINKETGEVYSWDPETGQAYTLEKLRVLGLYRADGRSDIFEPNTGRILPIDPETGAPYTIEKLGMLGVVNGRGGAYLVDRVTAQVYANDPDTGQPYTLEKLLELGKISADDYQKYAAIRQAAGDKSGEHSANQPLDVDKMLEELPEKAKLLAMAELREDVNGLGEAYSEATLQVLNEVGYFEKRQQLIEEYKAQLLAEQTAQVPQPTESTQQQLVSEQEAVQNVAAQPQTPVQSTPSKTSEPTKVLPRTSDTVSIFGTLSGWLLVGLGGLGLKRIKE